MKFVADESVDFGIINALRRIDAKVVSISEQYSGISDKEVLVIANENQCLLITEDKDFGELAYRLQLGHCGILLLRLNDLPRKSRIALVIEILINHFDKLRGKFSVLTPKGLRIKTIPRL